jgi:hypothetical protein
VYVEILSFKYGNASAVVEFLPSEIEDLIGHTEESFQVVGDSLKILRPYCLVGRLESALFIEVVFRWIS